jgi:hypothetical protein
MSMQAGANPSNVIRIPLESGACIVNRRAKMTLNPKLHAELHMHDGIQAVACAVR